MQIGQIANNQDLLALFSPKGKANKAVSVGEAKDFLTLLKGMKKDSLSDSGLKLDSGERVEIDLNLLKPKGQKFLSKAQVEKVQLDRDQGLVEQKSRKIAPQLIDEKILGSSHNVKKNPGFRTYKKEIQTFDDNLIRLPLAKVNGKTDDVLIESKEDQTASVSDLIVNDTAFHSGKESESLSQNAGKTGVLNLSQVKSASGQELINQISAYIEQSYISGSDNLDVIVNHDELGQFKVSAQKVGMGNQVNLQIEATTEQAQAFFSDSESELIKSLNRSGIKLSEFKITAFDNVLAFDNKGQPSLSQNSSEEGGKQDLYGQLNRESLEQDSERRRNLWQQFQEQRRQASA